MYINGPLTTKTDFPNYIPDNNENSRYAELS